MIAKHTVKVDSILPKSLTLYAVFTQGRVSMSSCTLKEFHADLRSIKATEADSIEATL